MHLPNGGHVLRYTGVSHDCTEAKIQPNGVVNAPLPQTHINSDKEQTNSNGQVSKDNQIQIALSESVSDDETLSSVLTAWTLLMQRYQRDVFHQFTWGNANATGEVSSQCISVTDIDLKSQKTITELQARIGDIRSKDLSTEASAIFLNDGTREEVRSLQITIDLS